MPQAAPMKWYLMSLFLVFVQFNIMSFMSMSRVSMMKFIKVNQTIKKWSW